MSRTNGALRPRIFDPLPLGSVRPRGWLLNQLRIQADGLSGHLDEFWPAVARSRWIGGDAEGWERGPYWLDGITPLAFLLDDARLKEKARHWIDYILAHQHEDGWLGPIQAPGHEPYDPWPLFVVLKALTQYQEATGDTRIVPAMTRLMRKLDSLLSDEGGALSGWGRFRWADLVISLHWLYERTGHKFLLDLAAKAHAQGFDWRASFAQFRHTGRIGLEELARFADELPEGCENADYLATHVVNNAMAVKAPGVWYRQSGDVNDRDAVRHIIATLERFHGQATGLFSGDEHLAGTNPSQGTELCAVVEYMFSLETVMAILGRVELADRLEKIAFNALPATFKPDMWAHQYDQQANQVLCAVSDQNVYTNNGPDANIFGLEPHFGCCTANMHQGWPKFAAHLWMGLHWGTGPSPGLVATAYAPSHVRTHIAGTPVEIEEFTDYPFDDTITFNVRTGHPVRFHLALRIPEWAEGAELTIG
ncbi:MAG: glycoside hydrolase family 127 protein, partial [Candidatus Hydrogenedentes bacterium]|nr:glycoside hydrolase family 127 protein [Candidatus Hydrogenedentota bacterium]